ncbi:hypothetical protein NX774_12290 [Massilia agilis]|uniref:Rap1a immunity protein domain-containing protein n=1 Tax=Massilia agilis TaxID=1811226 RepID=A0ABT2DBK4_9BURK|nr:Rap1a/Tai family immunity protein [Massilia agilis]MCS0808700.1 hypothetical protein [Massilia agilis]
MRHISFFIAAALAAHAHAQLAAVSPWMTGERLLELAKWPDGARDNLDLTPRQNLAQQQAKLYLHGVHDATEGKAWCYSAETRPKPAVLESAALDALRSMPPSQLKRNAADLVVQAWASAWPCRGGRS